MAKRGNKDLVERMRAAGLRKKVAVSVAEAMGSGPRKSQPKAVAKVVRDLRRLAEVLDDRSTGKSAKRRAAARKAAATRERKARARSAAAKKGAKKRAKAGRG